MLCHAASSIFFVGTNSEWHCEVTTATSDSVIRLARRLSSYSTYAGEGWFAEERFKFTRDFIRVFQRRHFFASETWPLI